MDTDGPGPLEQSRDDVCQIGLSPMMDCWLDYHMTIVAYVHQDYAQAADLADTGCAIESLTYTSIDIANFFTFQGLSHIANYRASGQKKRKALGIARLYVKQLRVFSKYNPRFCLGMMYLLQAEIAEVKEKSRMSEDTHNLYVTAAACFDSENMLMAHAVSKELMGRHMIKWGKKEFAEAYLEESIELFTKWGAVGKQKLLRRELERVSTIKDSHGW